MQLPRFLLIAIKSLVLLSRSILFRTHYNGISLTGGAFFIVACTVGLFACRTNAGTPATKRDARADSLAEIVRVTHGYQLVKELAPSIRSGDLVLRKGNDFTSEGLGSLNQRDKSYSHCGIASIENDSVFVYHALGGEFNPDQKIRRDPLAVFAEPESNRGIAQYRFDLRQDTLGNIVRTAQSFYRAGMMFDMKFSLDTDDRLYCAEFVYKVIRQATANSLIFNISHINDFRFIGVDDLFLQPRSHEIRRIVYK